MFPLKQDLRNINTKKPKMHRNSSRGRIKNTFSQSIINVPRKIFGGVYYILTGWCSPSLG